MRQTTNYQLPSWDSDDRILRTDFNDLTEKADAALADNAAAVAALTAQLAAKGNCRIETFSYTGDGTYGADHPTTITFPRMPVMFVVIGYRTLLIGSGKGTEGALIIRNSYSGSTGISDFELPWSGTQLVLISESYANYQLNLENEVYRVIAFYAEDE